MGLGNWVGGVVGELWRLYKRYGIIKSRSEFIRYLKKEVRKIIKKIINTLRTKINRPKNN